MAQHFLPLPQSAFYSQDLLQHDGTCTESSLGEQKQPVIPATLKEAWEDLSI